jgi:UDP-GlcNAc:undecaprenyl-phosphate GlcNAc-1-phosphate transferase
VQALNPLQLAALAAAVSLLVIPLMSRLAPRLGLVDVPDARKVHTVPVPRVGGWGIAIGGLTPLLLWLKFDALLQSYVAATVILFAFGIWDDHKSLGHWSKFFGQVLAASVIVYYGGLFIARIPFLDGDGLSALIGRPLTVFALVGVTNAINHSDGLDGLAAGESMLTLIGLTILGYLAGSALVVAIALASMGGILGFLRYNSYPARVFMGDAGSQVLGLTLGFLTIYLTQKADAALSAAVPLLLLGLPVADILVVLYRRIATGANWFKASRNHVHHRLLDLGFSHYQTVIAMYSVHAALVVGAVLLRYQSDTDVAAVYLLMMLGLFGGLMVAERRGWRREPEPAANQDGPKARWRSLVNNQRLRHGAQILIAVAAPGFMLLGSLWAGHIPRDIGLVAALLAIVLAAELAFARAVRSLVVRITVYVAATASAYLLINFPGAAAPHSVEIAALALVVALVASIGAYVPAASKDKFGTTPTDYLIVFALVALMILAAIDARARTLVEIIVFTVVLLYGCEVLIGRSIRRWNGVNVATLLTLTIIALRGLL